MINVTFLPDIIPLNQSCYVKLCFSYEGAGYCTNIKFTFRVPKDIYILEGDEVVEIGVLKADEPFFYPIRLIAKQIGQANAINGSFTYWDAEGNGVRTKASIPLTVIPRQDAEDEVDILTSGIQQSSFSTIEKMQKLGKEIPLTFSREELRILCFKMNINHENFNDTRIDGFTREFLERCRRRGLVDELFDKCQELRPHVDWTRY